MNRESLQPYVWMLLGSISFAFMGNLAHVADKTCDWQVVAVARSLIPLLLVGTIAVASGTRLVFWSPAVLWMRSVAGSISLIGTFFALSHLPTSDVFTITNMFPIWVAVLSWPLLGVIPSAKVWLAVLCGVAGVFVIQQPHIVTGNSASLVAVSISVFTALAMIGLHRLKGIDTRAIVVHFSAVALLFALASCFFFERQYSWSHVLEGSHLLTLLGVGCSATIGQLFLTKAFTYGDPARVSVIGLTQIVFALAIEAVILRNVPDAAKLLGIPLVVAPSAWLMWQQSHAPEPTVTEADLSV